LVHPFDFGASSKLAQELYAMRRAACKKRTLNLGCERGLCKTEMRTMKAHPAPLPHPTPSLTKN